MQDEIEISLRELIEIPLRYKWSIALITLVAVLTTAVAVFFVVPPIYQAESKLIVADFKPSTKVTSTDLVAGLPIYPDFTIDSYREQLKNPEVISKALADLSLDPSTYTVESVSDIVTIDAIKGTNLIKIKVKDRDPLVAAQIANALAVSFTTFITTLTQEHANQTVELLEGALSSQEGSLNEVQSAYTEFLKQPNGVPELTSEVSSIISQVTSFKSALAQIEIDTAVEEAKQSSMRTQLDQTEKYLVTTKTIVDDPASYNLVQGKETSGGTALLEVKSEDYNPLYLKLQDGLSTSSTTLARLKAQHKDTLSKVTRLQNSLEVLQVELADKSYQADTLQRNITVAQKTFYSHLDKLAEVRIGQSTNLGEAAVVISSRAIVPMDPISPNKKLALVVAAIAGMMIGVSAAFLKGYWDSTTLPADRSMVS